MNTTTYPDDRRFIAKVITCAALFATTVLMLAFGGDAINAIFGAMQ